MAYQHTSASDSADLLDKLDTFAAADGWTIVFNGLYQEQYKQLGLYDSNCYIAIGMQPGEDDHDRGNGQFDRFLNAALSTALSGTKIQYWDHTGSLVISPTSSDRIRWNDLYGILNNVWFFSGADDDVPYIHMIVQSSGERYTHFGFGILDSMGQTHPDCAFACGGVHYWWDASVHCHDPASSSHDFGHLAGENYAHIYTPSGVLPTGFPSEGIYVTEDAMTQSMTRANQEPDHWDNEIGKILDFYYPLGNQLTTGGNQLYSVPWLFQDSTAHVMLGRLPGMRLANIEQYVPGTELTYADETWVVFPWKRKGFKVNLKTGTNPIQVCNTAEHAWAFKKNVV